MGLRDTGFKAASSRACGKCVPGALACECWDANSVLMIAQQMFLIAKPSLYTSGTQSSCQSVSSIGIPNKCHVFPINMKMC